jgi:hypothetical protein
MYVMESFHRSADFYKKDHFIEKETEDDAVLSIGAWVEPSEAL